MSYAEQHAVLNEQVIEQRYRAAVISSAAVHLFLLLALLFGPLLVPIPTYNPSFTPVRLIQLPPAAPPPTPAAETPQDDVEPEPVQPLVSEPEAVPRSLEDLQREQEAEEERLRDEAERERQAELDRQRRAEQERQRAEEARQQREDEARRQPQTAGRRPPQNQSAQRMGIDVTQSGDSGYTVEEFPFADYLYRIRDLIAAQWSPPPTGPYGLKRRAEAFFRLGRNGRLVVQPRVDGGSGDTAFDRAAMRAIAAAAPFPPLPREYDGQSLGVGLAFVTE